jgi:hypothetical protein
MNSNSDYYNADKSNSRNKRKSKMQTTSDNDTAAARTTQMTNVSHGCVDDPSIAFCNASSRFFVILN